MWFGGNTVKKKPSLITWDKVCKSKNQGGLGVLDIQRMNNSLLAKWLFWFYDNKITGTWNDIIFEKYSPTGDRRLKSTL